VTRRCGLSGGGGASIPRFRQRSHISGTSFSDLRVGDQRLAVRDGRGDRITHDLLADTTRLGRLVWRRFKDAAQPQPPLMMSRFSGELWSLPANPPLSKGATIGALRARVFRIRREIA
jgi:hypothetical protein